LLETCDLVVLAQEAALRLSLDCDPSNPGYHVWMWDRGFIAVVCLTLLATYGFWWDQNQAQTSSEAALFAKLDQSLNRSPPDAEDIIQAFQLSDSCRTKTCWISPGAIAGLRYEKGNLRQPKDGLIFVLEGFTGTCIRTQRAEAHFGLGAAEQVCSHGECWYRTAQHSWGILGFGIDAPDSQCVSSVVINTTDHQRPRPD
jgi:hypothetical protein